MEPKAKKKYKTKKEKDVDVEEFVITTQTMVDMDFHDEKAQSLRDLVEEVVEPAP